jgi:hypothetical protein
MNKKLIQLSQRRERLLAQAAAQRIKLTKSAGFLRPHLLLVDRGIATLRYLKRHPAIFMGASLILASLRLKHTGKWIQRAWIGWQLGRKLFKK